MDCARNEDKDWYNAYTSLRLMEGRKETCQINKDLVFCIENRNVFAHCIPDTTDEALELSESVGFLKFKNITDKISFTPKQFEDLQATIIRLSGYISDHNHI